MQKTQFFSKLQKVSSHIFPARSAMRIPAFRTVRDRIIEKMGIIMIMVWVFLDNSAARYSAQNQHGNQSASRNDRYARAKCHWRGKSQRGTNIANCNCDRWEGARPLKRAGSKEGRDLPSDSIIKIIPRHCSNQRPFSRVRPSNEKTFQITRSVAQSASSCPAGDTELFLNRDFGFFLRWHTWNFKFSMGFDEISKSSLNYRAYSVWKISEQLTEVWVWLQNVLKLFRN